VLVWGWGSWSVCSIGEVGEEEDGSLKNGREGKRAASSVDDRATDRRAIDDFDHYATYVVATAASTSRR